jgi:hypothetical protein
MEYGVLYVRRTVAAASWSFMQLLCPLGPPRGGITMNQGCSFALKPSTNREFVLLNRTEPTNTVRSTIVQVTPLLYLTFPGSSALDSIRNSVRSIRRHWYLLVQYPYLWYPKYPYGALGTPYKLRVQLSLLFATLLFGQWLGRR